MNRPVFVALRRIMTDRRSAGCLLAECLMAGCLMAGCLLGAVFPASAQRTNTGDTIPVGFMEFGDLISGHDTTGAFPIVSAGDRLQGTSVSLATPILVDTADHWLVRKAADWLCKDIQKVTDLTPLLLSRIPTQATDLIIIGSLDRSPLIRQLANAGKINVTTLKGKWESYSYQVILHPFKGIGKALVIIGSDKRGTAYGALELSREMGVSPWYWWADVPVRKQNALYLHHAPYFSGSPGVKYRGIFINDEAPAFSGWTRATFGGVNHLVYEKMFELLLRLKANYLWPAMWGNAFNDDDTLNPILADQYGIVMGTSHHEPMLRAQQEWKRYGTGAWNYVTNAPVLQDFWKKGIQHMGTHESIVTVGMRGDGDMPMTEGSNIALLEKIVADQRRIIGEVTGKNPADVPQSWALYKEVQDYYDKGMRVPDDVTLLLCDDNWGNIRKLPKPGSPERRGGYGIYYHFDYVGDPRNYKWLNTNSIPRVWEQMKLAYDNEVRQIWIVNVGDLKPMELPISFFLDYAWSPSEWPIDRVEAYARNWAAEQFGPLHAAAIGHILSEYTFYNSRRKPELLSPGTYSLTAYREAEKVVAQYNTLTTQAEELYAEMAAADRDAFYELVLYPVKACANLNELYVSAARNHWYALQGRAATNALADSVRARFAEDSLLSHEYNTVLAGGKWTHMMDQTHIGYTHWQEPRVNSMPAVQTIPLRDTAEMGVAVEGADSAAGATAASTTLPLFSVYSPGRHYIDIFNKGTIPFEYHISASAPWVRITAADGRVKDEQRVWISIDMRKAPEGKQGAALLVTGPSGQSLTVRLALQGALADPLGAAVPSVGFVEDQGYAAMNADHYTRAVNTSAVHWVRIARVGKIGTGMTPARTTAHDPGAHTTAHDPGAHTTAHDRTDSSYLEYAFYTFDTGVANLQAYCAPTLDYENTRGRRFAVSIDNGPLTILHLPAEQTGPVWSSLVGDNIAIVGTSIHLSRQGPHILRYWKVDPGVVLEKIVLDLGGAKACYLGPPETPMRPGLKDYFRDDFPVGVAVSPYSLKGPDTGLILQQFNSLTPENVMKMGPIHPLEQQYHFGEADSIVAFAQAHGLRVRGHNLCWHQQTPAWLFKDDTAGLDTRASATGGNRVTKDVLLQRLKDHITTVVGRYKGRIYAWDVVNEAISDDSTQFLRNSLWYQICGEDFIKKAFQYAHAADPVAQLFYNDYNTERPEKRNRVYRLLKDLVDEGIPITGVGLQGHWSIYEPSGKDLRDAIEQFSSLGLKVQITELDVSVYPWEKNDRARLSTDSDTLTQDLQERQSRQYKALFDIFREYASVISGVTFWNITDRHTWLDDYPVKGRKNYPLLFDTEGAPKEAYWEVTGQ